jgi:cold shock CspA family protein
MAKGTVKWFNESKALFHYQDDGGATYSFTTQPYGNVLNPV